MVFVFNIVSACGEVFFKLFTKLKSLQHPNKNKKRSNFKVENLIQTNVPVSENNGFETTFRHSQSPLVLSLKKKKKLDKSKRTNYRIIVFLHIKFLTCTYVLSTAEGIKLNASQPVTGFKILRTGSLLYRTY